MRQLAGRSLREAERRLEVVDEEGSDSTKQS